MEVKNYSWLNSNWKLHLIVIIFLPTPVFQCYSCTSDYWDINENCEKPTKENIKDVDCTPSDHCMMAYLSYPNLLYRGCGYYMDFERTRKNYLYGQKCYEALASDIACTKFIFDDFYELEGDRENFETKNKSCLRCSSTDSETRKRCETEAKDYITGAPCKNRLCTTIYRSKSKLIMRNCFTWKKIREFIKNPPEPDWTIEWCVKSECNERDISSYPGCEGRESGNEIKHDGGCIVPGTGSDVKAESGGDRNPQYRSPATLLIYLPLSVCICFTIQQ